MRTKRISSITFNIGLGIMATALSLALIEGRVLRGEGGHGQLEGGNHFTPENSTGGYDEGGDGVIPGDGVKGVLPNDGAKLILEGGMGYVEGGNNLHPAPRSTEGGKGYWEGGGSSLDGGQGSTEIGNGCAVILTTPGDGPKGNKEGGGQLSEGGQNLLASGIGSSILWECPNGLRQFTEATTPTDGPKPLYDGGQGFASLFGVISDGPKPRALPEGGSGLTPTEGPKPNASEGTKGYNEDPEGGGNLVIDGPKSSTPGDGVKPTGQIGGGGNLVEAEGGNGLAAVPNDGTLIGIGYGDEPNGVSVIGNG